MSNFIKKLLRVFPGSLTVKTLHSQCMGYSSHPWLGNKDTACLAMRPKKKKRKEKKKLLNDFPKQFYYFTCPLATCGGHTLAKAWYSLSVNFNHSSKYVSHWGFNLHVPSGQWWQTSSHMYMGHLNIVCSSLLSSAYILIELSCLSYEWVIKLLYIFIIHKKYMYVCI